MSGVRATLAVREPDGCPLVELSASNDAELTDVSWSGGDRVIEEFTAPGPVEAEGVEPVFETNGGTVHRFVREPDGCACELVEEAGTPVSGARAVGDTLYLTLHLAEAAELHDLVPALSAVASSVQVRQLVSAGEADGSDPVVVDRGRLTDRQREVLRTASELGYFEYPRGANAEAVARELDIAPSTFRQHLNAAQSKLLGAILEGAFEDPDRP